MPPPEFGSLSNRSDCSALRRSAAPKHLRHAALVVCAGLAVVLGGCATSPPHPTASLACTPGRLDRLYFGQNMPGGEVGAAQWRDFIDDVIAPRFPDGFSEYLARGQWRSAQGSIDSETSRVIEIAHDGGAASRERIGEIARIYRARFRQEAVLVVSADAEICFAR